MNFRMCSKLKVKGTDFRTMLHHNTKEIKNIYTHLLNISVHTSTIKNEDIYTLTDDAIQKNKKKNYILIHTATNM